MASSSGLRGIEELFEQLRPPRRLHTAVPLSLSIIEFFERGLDIRKFDANFVSGQSAFSTHLSQQPLPFSNEGGQPRLMVTLVRSCRFALDHLFNFRPPKQIYALEPTRYLLQRAVAF